MYFIRKHNSVYNGVDIAIGIRWSDITDKTKQLPVIAFTTRKDAGEQLAIINDPDAMITNSLDYVNE